MGSLYSEDVTSCSVYCEPCQLPVYAQLTVLASDNRLSSDNGNLT